MSDDAFDTERSCDLLVSIINYRTVDLTIACIKSVLADFEHSPGWPANGQIVVVDNASGDGSADRIAEWISEASAPVTLIRSATNTGFSGGHNQGINARKAHHYLVLNSDAVLRPGFCEHVLKAATAHPKAGLIAPRLEYDDGTPQISCFRLPSPASELIRGAETGPITRLFKRYDMPLGTEPTTQDIGWSSFACILLRADMLEEIGPMDDGYFLYFEDTEFCLRAGRAGWKIAHTPKARAVHFRGGSAPVKALAHARKRLPAYYYASRSRLFYQSYGYAGLWFANLMWHVGRGVARLRVVFGKPVPNGVEAEARDIWINALTPMRIYDATGPRT
ncbi:glycosyltransferase family 2 protein [Tateyamaria sp. ANG-S1]|uniref:glycosyltransferase family 2 protein n=1 Tax=Tateyamaria sp. ANG-S1 TaxID=1577905 RepID=UPI00068BC180|nr:glycosyltransferase family 2 protein [Tateyamaria sp. ANG-S1]